ncbi:uncharacterized protein LOC110731990 [Chenopodium quinoa]|uniref:uncharacterized protein LOC110731990 n=1 Tax=Chenopodium quinoa TaxID=63459 RepID=UPI000B78B981|nr:uncharacterized protein LOC110731990 [Chenopodium quinoa]XP_021767600.1 uncharacterized protein LOC110731990 [Chenopodium quinoa]XP_021767601.1 uncharacterized protein LOC110731990 [Chenopodium quinoa]
MLYWGDFSKEDKCHVCGTSRWKKNKGTNDNVRDQDKTISRSGEPAKVMRYCPLFPRLKRIYMSSKTAEDMRWHYTHNDKLNDVDKKMLRHPSDALAWKSFDQRYEDCASDPRSVRLGLASDGFNPYRLMNTTYSTWPVVLIPYNLPPWLCMKPSSFMLSIIIPGNTSPGIDIDVYLQPLVHELKLLWSGVDAFDAYDGEKFKLRGAFLWTINDFPSYAMLSGLSTKSYMACPICIDSTPSEKFGSKTCYCGYRKLLTSCHPYRFESDSFNGSEEHGEAPPRPSGTDILGLQENVGYVYGKASKRKRGNESNNEEDVVIGTKRSIFYDLEYWEHNLLRHNLDVMHIEKIVCDNILNTLLNTDKSRDKKDDRDALQGWGINPHLWVQDNHMPSISYSMSV